MAKNLSRKYATMSEDERNRFRVEEIEGVKERRRGVPSPYEDEEK